MEEVNLELWTLSSSSCLGQERSLLDFVQTLLCVPMLTNSCGMKKIRSCHDPQFENLSPNGKCNFENLKNLRSEMNSVLPHILSPQDC